MNKEKYNDIDYYVERLKHITQLLSKYSTMTFAIFLCSLIVIIIGFYLRLRGFCDYRSENLIVVLLTGLLFPVFGILILFRFSQLSKRGMTYYEEIIDESEWGNSKENTKRVPLNIRVATKEFLRATDMPIIKGNMGITIYFLLFIALIITQAFSLFT